MATVEEIVEDESLSLSTTYAAQVLATMPADFVALSTTIQTHTAVLLLSELSLADTHELHAYAVLSSALGIGSQAKASQRWKESLVQTLLVESAAAYKLTARATSAADFATTLSARHFANIIESVLYATTQSAKAKSSVVLGSSVALATAVSYAQVVSLLSSAAFVSTLGPVNVLTSIGATVATTGEALPRAKRAASVAEAVRLATTTVPRRNAKIVASSAVHFESVARLTGDAVGVAPSVFWTNTKTGGAAVWDHVPMQSTVVINGALHGAGAAGLYTVDAEGDHVGSVKWDLMDLGTPQLKTLGAAYIEAWSAAPMTFRVGSNQGSYTYVTHQPAGSAEFQNHRATLGKGLKSVAYRFEINLTEPARVKSIAVQIAEAARRIRG